MANQEVNEIHDTLHKTISKHHLDLLHTPLAEISTRKPCYRRENRAMRL